MQREMMLAKIHRATVTQTDLNYKGSITIDKALISAAGFLPFEKVEIYNIDNGNRFATYVIEGKKDSGIIGINGAAAHLVDVGDKVIIVSYGYLDAEELKKHNPTVVLVDDENKVSEIGHYHTGDE